MLSCYLDQLYASPSCRSSLSLYWIESSITKQIQKIQLQLFATPIPQFHNSTSRINSTTPTQANLTPTSHNEAPKQIRTFENSSKMSILTNGLISSSLAFQWLLWDSTNSSNTQTPTIIPDSHRIPNKTMKCNWISNEPELWLDLRD